MKLLLRFVAVAIVGFAGVSFLAAGIGRHFPNTVIAYIETCGNSAGSVFNTGYIDDWRPGIRVAIPQAEAPTLSVSWSPDGNQLAYTVYLSNYGHEIYIYDLETGMTHQQTDDPYSLNMASSWSPNGHSIVFFSDGLVAVADTVTNQVQTFPIHIVNNVYLNAWSPDGDSLAIFGFYPEARGEIYILNMITGDIQDLSRARFVKVNHPAWSPDGRYVMFSGFNGRGSTLYLADIQTNTLSLLPNSKTLIYVGSAWSPDGQTIATMTGQSEIYLFDLSGNLRQKINLQQLLPGLLSGGGQIGWSPDGAYLTLFVSVNFRWGSYAYNLSTGVLHSLSPKNCAYSPIAWRPDHAASG